MGAGKVILQALCSPFGRAPCGGQWQRVHFGQPRAPQRNGKSGWNSVTANSRETRNQGLPSALKVPGAFPLLKGCLLLRFSLDSATRGGGLKESLKDSLYFKKAKKLKLILFGGRQKMGLPGRGNKRPHPRYFSSLVWPKWSGCGSLLEETCHAGRGQATAGSQSQAQEHGGAYMWFSLYFCDPYCIPAAMPLQWEYCLNMTEGKKRMILRPFKMKIHF